MDETGKSDSRIVPKKVPNKAGRPAAEGLEGRRLAKRNPPQATTLRTQAEYERTRHWGEYGKQLNSRRENDSPRCCNPHLRD